MQNNKGEDRYPMEMVKKENQQQQLEVESNGNGQNEMQRREILFSRTNNLGHKEGNKNKECDFWGF